MRTEAALGVVGVVEVVPLRPREQQLKRAGGESIAAVGVDYFDHVDEQPGEEDERETRAGMEIFRYRFMVIEAYRRCAADTNLTSIPIQR